MSIISEKLLKPHSDSYIETVLGSIWSKKEAKTTSILRNLIPDYLSQSIPKLFAHICARKQIKGSGLEGNYSSLTLSYLALMLREIKGVDSCLVTRIIRCQRWRQQALDASPNIDQVAREITQRAQGLQEGESLLLPGGWAGGHFMLYELTKSNSHYTLRVINAGKGTDFHPSLCDDKKAHTLLAITYKNIPPDKLFYGKEMSAFFQMLIGPTSACPKNGRQAEMIYEGILKPLAPYRDDLEMMQQGDEAWITPHSPGICTWKAPMAYLRLVLGKKEYKRVSLIIKMRTLEGYYQLLKSHSFSSDLTTKQELNLLEIGQQNVARYFLKTREKITFDPEEETRALALLEEIKAFVNQRKEKQTGVLKPLIFKTSSPAPNIDPWEADFPLTPLDPDATLSPFDPTYQCFFGNQKYPTEKMGSFISLTHPEGLFKIKKGQETHIAFQPYGETTWYQFASKKQLRQRANGVPLSLLEGYHHFYHADKKEWIFVKDKNYHPDSILRWKQGSKWVQSRSHRYSLATCPELERLEKREGIEKVELLQGGARSQFVRLPRYHLTFEVDPLNNNTLRYQEDPTFTLQTQENIEPIEGLKNYVILENAQGIKKMLIPSLPIKKAHGFESTAQLAIPDKDDATCSKKGSIPYHVYLISYGENQEMILEPQSQEGALALAYYRLHERGYSEALTLLKSSSFSPPLPPQSERILTWIANYGEVEKHVSPQQTALSLYAWTLLIRNQTKNAPKCSTKKLDVLYKYYLKFMTPLCPTLKLKIEDELLIIDSLLTPNSVSKKRRQHLTSFENQESIPQGLLPHVQFQAETISLSTSIQFLLADFQKKYRAHLPKPMHIFEREEFFSCYEAIRTKSNSIQEIKTWIWIKIAGSINEKKEIPPPLKLLLLLLNKGSQSSFPAIPSIAGKEQGEQFSKTLHALIDGAKYKVPQAPQIDPSQYPKNIFKTPPKNSPPIPLAGLALHPSSLAHQVLYQALELDPNTFRPEKENGQKAREYFSKDPEGKARLEKVIQKLSCRMREKKAAMQQLKNKLLQASHPLYYKHNLEIAPQLRRLANQVPILTIKMLEKAILTNDSSRLVKVNPAFKEEGFQKEISSRLAKYEIYAFELIQTEKALCLAITHKKSPNFCHALKLFEALHHSPFDDTDFKTKDTLIPLEKFISTRRALSTSQQERKIIRKHIEKTKKEGLPSVSRYDFVWQQLLFLCNLFGQFIYSIPQGISHVIFD